MNLTSKQNAIDLVYALDIAINAIESVNIFLLARKPAEAVAQSTVAVEERATASEKNLMGL